MMPQAKLHAVPCKIPGADTIKVGCARLKPKNLLDELAALRNQGKKKDRVPAVLIDSTVLVAIEKSDIGCVVAS